MATFYEKMQSVVRKLSKPTKFGRQCIYFKDRLETQVVLFDGLVGEEANRRVGGKPLRRTEGGVTITVSLDQFPEEPEKDRIIKVGGLRYRIDGIEKTSIAYTFECVDLNR